MAKQTVSGGQAANVERASNEMARIMERQFE
jgi:hypothetical protein